ncbi:MAG: hypothetical protein KGO05_01580 [Chloroflexota bacterium]|nr:hypothetical protein [Chloroflexota bacterium]
MHEVSWRWALTMSVIAVVVGVAALLIGAFVAPIPVSQSDALQFMTAVFVRGFLGLVALIVAIILAYIGGYRIQSTFEPTPPTPSPAMASSPLLALFTTPGPRRDALFAGALTLLAYWFFTTIYIAALGRNVGGIGSASSVPSFILARLALGVALAAAGGGAGALGARNAFTRTLTRRILSGDDGAKPAEPPAAQAETNPRLPIQGE